MPRFSNWVVRRFPPKSPGSENMKIGLLDHMGFGNLGDAATQEVVIANIRKRLPGVRLVGFSLVPDDTEKRHGIPCHPIRRWCPKPREKEGNYRIKSESRLKLALKKTPLVSIWAKPLLEFLREMMFWARSYRALRDLNILIVSGGGQLCELWHGPWSHPYTIFKFSVLAKLARKKLFFLNVGAGPLEHPLSRLFTRAAVQLADYRSLRDRDSEELVRSLGVKQETHVFPDSVYAMEIGDQLKIAFESSGSIVALNPIGFCDPRIWPRKDSVSYQNYLEKLTTFAVWLLDEGYTLRVFTTEVSVDHYAIQDLKARLRSRVPSDDRLSRIFRPASDSVDGVLQEMAGFDFVVTSKFHGIIFSHLLRKPVISLSYQRKMDVVMQALGQGRFCADIENFDVNWLIEAFRSLVRESNSIKSDSAKAVQAYAAALSQQFDSLFLPDRTLGLSADSRLPLSESVVNTSVASDETISRARSDFSL